MLDVDSAREAYARAFENRRPKAPLLPGSHFPFYYGVTIRGVRVIALDITRAVRDSDPQVDWLAEVLASPEKPRLTLVLGHFPLSPVHFTHLWDIVGSRRLLALLHETPDLIYFQCAKNLYNDFTMYNGLYRKSDGSVMMSPTKEAFKDDLTGFAPFTPISRTSKGGFVGVLKIEQVQEWIEEHPEVKLEGALAPLKNLDFDANPVVVIVEP